jgi:hypothetical protein
MTKRSWDKIAEGGDISLNVAISQSVQALDLAASLATDVKDVDSLLKISGA